jgi:hypothetical protein
MPWPTFLSAVANPGNAISRSAVFSSPIEPELSTAITTSICVQAVFALPLPLPLPLSLPLPLPLPLPLSSPSSPGIVPVQDARSAAMAKRPKTMVRRMAARFSKAHTVALRAHPVGFAATQR